MDKIESTICTICLLAHLNEYRKIYRLCGGVRFSVPIASGLIGCGAVAALTPAVPIAVAIADAIPAGITFILRFAKVEEKKAGYKAQSRIFKQLFAEAR